jgi:hypothetical protein
MHNIRGWEKVKLHFCIAGLPLAQRPFLFVHGTFTASTQRKKVYRCLCFNLLIKIVGSICATLYSPRLVYLCATYKHVLIGIDHVDQITYKWSRPWIISFPASNYGHTGCGISPDALWKTSYNSRISGHRRFYIGSYVSLCYDTYNKASQIFVST